MVSFLNMWTPLFLDNEPKLSVNVDVAWLENVPSAGLGDAALRDFVRGAEVRKHL